MVRPRIKPTPELNQAAIREWGRQNPDWTSPQFKAKPFNPEPLFALGLAIHKKSIKYDNLDTKYPRDSQKSQDKSKSHTTRTRRRFGSEYAHHITNRKRPHVPDNQDPRKDHRRSRRKIRGSRFIPKIST